MDTDMLDTHMPELTDTHTPELTPTELTHMDTDMLHTATDMLDTHTVTPDTHTLMDTESRLVKLLKNPYIHSSYQQSFIQNLWNLKTSIFPNKFFVKLNKTV